jgi:carbamate kinase
MASQSKLAVVAVGGNSLISDKSRESIPDQYEAVGVTARYIVA